tara:strand:- start:1733 stop:3067 length:1335 start_codon:yes stop_codon:yes gene_type:complete
MFRGGAIDSRGTGITSGLTDTSKPKRGLVDEPGGYAGEEFLIGQGLYDEFINKPNTTPSKPSIAKRGMDILKSARNKIYGIPYLGKTLKTTVGAPLRYAGAALSSPYAMAAAPVAAVGGLAYMNRPKTVEALQYMKQMNETGVFDETDPDGFQQYSEVFDELNDVTKYTPLKESKVGLFSGQKEIAEDIEDRDMEEFEAMTKGDLTATVRPGETAVEAVFREGEEKARTRDAIENPPEPTIEDVKSQLEKDKELFKELLGADKARGRDIGDMLASASASFLGTGQVKEGFAEFMANQARSGPSRTEKLNQTAAGLAINDYIAGRKSKRDLETILAKTKFGVDYSLGAQASAKDLTKKSWVKALGSRAEDLKSSEGKNEVIKSTLFQKFEKPAYVISGYETKPYNEIKTEDLKVGFNIISYEGGKIIIEKLSDGSVQPRTDLPVS